MIGMTLADSRAFLGIDQICIDQKNFAERMQQVRLMRAIYQRAQNTVIWLGPDESSVREAFSLVNDLYQLSRVPQRNERRPLAQGQPLAEIMTQPPPEEDKRWASLSRFLDLPWFERCWIIQEVVVSQGDPVILCGGHQTLWSRVKESLEWVAQTHARLLNTERMRLVKGIFELTSTKDVWELQSLLHSTRSFQAKDPRDKVFALLGLAGESRAPDHWPKALMPNYDRSTRDVYTEVTRYCIQKTRTLSILSQVGTSGAKDVDKDSQQYPSWVPRWDLPHSASSLSAYTTVQTGNDWRMLVERHNNASKDLPVSLDAYSSPDVLRLEGIRVSTVESCLPAAFPDQVRSNSTASFTADIHSKLLKNIPELYEMCQLRLSHLPAADILKRFAMVTTAGLTARQEAARHDPMHAAHARAFLLSAAPKTPETDSQNPMYSLRTALRSNLSVSTLTTPTISPPASTESLASKASASHSHPHLYTRSSSNAWLTATSTGTPTYGTRALDSPFGEQKADAARYTSALSPMIHRRLFVTSERQLGLGPVAMMSGDVVVVLFGGRVPFVLRRTEGGEQEESWRLVGECYVDGVMGSEIVEGREAEHEWFDLV
ncbi:hypothetical protein CC80DRAFT_131627 [Byssothecium circinans]|uniref:Heterokaryon incompatibility domain-containing protein n=1 Tax=Byssothecium circinans TaxID=147558 RepID=A0A6A5TN55_9PLEO|nr:hypothetical protein CC80DRAFT_131627 [Byssothecium circinans]